MRTSKADLQGALRLRPFRLEDITERFLSWFRNPKITRYLESSNITKQEAIEHFDNSRYFYAIEVDGVHIGNVKIYDIDRQHGLAHMSCLIGDTDYWGSGLGTVAIRQAMEIAWEIGVRKLSGGIYSDNAASIKAYTRAGWAIEDVRKDHYILDGKMQDRVLVSAWNPALQNTPNCYQAGRHLRSDTNGN